MEETEGAPLEELWDAEFGNLFDQRKKAIFRFFANRGVSLEESHDLTQETFCEAIRSRRSFAGRSKLSTWLHGIASNTLRRYRRDGGRLRRQGEELSFEAMEEPHRDRIFERSRGLDPETPLSRLLASEQAAAVREAIDELPIRNRECLRLRLCMGLKYREIATVLRLGEGTVKKYVFEARQQIEKRLAPYYAAEEPESSP